VNAHVLPGRGAQIESSVSTGVQDLIPKSSQESDVASLMTRHSLLMEPDLHLTAWDVRAPRFKDHWTQNLQAHDRVLWASNSPCRTSEEVWDTGGMGTHLEASPPRHRSRCEPSPPPSGSHRRSLRVFRRSAVRQRRTFRSTPLHEESADSADRPSSWFEVDKSLAVSTEDTDRTV